MNCPQCGLGLVAVDYHGVEVEACPGCGGEWLDAQELGKIVRIRGTRFDDAAVRAAAQAPPLEGLPAEAFDRQLVCPKCGGQTQPLNYGGDSGIILDRCAGCGGFWLDAQELERVQMLVEGWDARLPEVMRVMSPKLEIVAATNANVGQAQVSRLPVVGRFVNALINGMIRLAG